MRSQIQHQGLSNWNAFFSSLSFAEKAAATQCLLISQQFQKQNQPALASEYRKLFEEEISHYNLASQVCKNLCEPSKKAQAIYAGEFFSNDNSLLERLAVIHLIFEPAALAFLGYLFQEAKNIFTDEVLIQRIQNNFGQILRDEVGHVQNGSKVIASLWSKVSDNEKKTVLKSMRRHKAFLIAGLKSFFKNDADSLKHIDPMLSRFEFFFQKATKRVAA